MTTSFTRYFRWGIPDFTTGPWHGDWDTLVRSIDRTLYSALIAAGAVEWTNATAFEPGTIAIDPDDGTIWVVEVAHTSAVSPTTFAQDRTANPTFWSSLTPADEILEAVTRAELAASQSMASMAQSQSLFRRMTGLLGQVVLRVAEAAGAASRAHSHEARARRYANSTNSDYLMTQSTISLVAGYVAMAERAKRRAAASAASIGDDQIVLKSQVFTY